MEIAYTKSHAQIAFSIRPGSVERLGFRYSCHFLLMGYLYDLGGFAEAIELMRRFHGRR